jgi:hypothetical protein
MSKSRFFQTSLVSGALSPLLKGRVDIDQYYQGAEVAKNLVIVPQGGMKRRAGTQYVEKALNVISRKSGYVPTMPEGGTGSVIADGSDSTTTSTTDPLNSEATYVVAQYDLTTAQKLEFVDIRKISASTGTVTTLRVQWSDDNVTWSTGNELPTVGTSPQDFRLNVEATARYWRLVSLSSSSTATLTLAQMDLIFETNTKSNVKLLDFSVESDRHYLLILTDGNIRVIRTPDTRVADIRVPLSSYLVPDVRDTQTENVMLLFQEDLPPQRLINLGTDEDWFVDEVPFINIPQFDYNDAFSPTPVNDVQRMTLSSFVAGDTFQLDIEGVLSKNITFAGDANADQRESTVFNIQKNIQEMPVMGDTGVSVSYVSAGVYDITVGGESAKDFELYSGFATSGTASKTVGFVKTASGSPRKEDVWSSGRGYPKTACFYESRLILGGTRSKPQSLFASKTGSFFDFDIDDGDDDEGIFATISSRKLNDIVDVFPGRTLQIFTSGAEFAVTVKPLTPSTIAITPQTSHGASNIEVQEVDGSTLFIDRNGKTLRDFIYSFNEDAYTTQDKSVLASNLIRQPIDLALLTGTQSEDSNWLFIINSDGGAAILNTLRSQDINGYTEWTTSGALKSGAVVDDQFYVVNEREINEENAVLRDRFDEVIRDRSGAIIEQRRENPVSYIERWDFSYLMDSSIKVSPTPIQTVITGLDHLEGETIQIVGDGIVLSPKTVLSGQIELDANEIGYSEIELGLNFVPELIPMPLNTNIGSGQNAMRLKRIIRVNMRVYETYGVTVDGNPVPIRTFGEAPTTPLDSAPTALSGIISDIYDVNGWNRDVMPTISVPDPTPFHIQAIEYEVESS